MSAVKVGDRVRLTCGESTLVGTVLPDEYSEGLNVLVDGDRARYFPSSKWTVEVIAPPIPSADGTIVRDHEGSPWIAGTNGWYRAGFSTPFTQTYMQKKYGPLTVLWTPEAKS